MNPPPPKRIRLTVHYDGRAFFGWQVQPEQRTVQGELERVLTRLTDRPAAVVGAGRTDRGVHATGQVAAVDVPAKWTADALRRSMNALLPPDVWVAAAADAAPYFHPRYDAATRAYIYRVGLAPEAHSPFHAPFCWPLTRRLEHGAMAEAATAVLGDHSFSSFAKAGQEERGDRCVVTASRWTPWGAMGLEYQVTANRFLHHMVRYLVGTMVEIGMGARPVADMTDLLSARPASETSPPAPPGGLFLSSVTYPPDAGMHPPRRRAVTDETI